MNLTMFVSSKVVTYASNFEWQKVRPCKRRNIPTFVFLLNSKHRIFRIFRIYQNYSIKIVLQKFQENIMKLIAKLVRPKTYILRSKIFVLRSKTNDLRSKI